MNITKIPVWLMFVVCVIIAILGLVFVLKDAEAQQNFAPGQGTQTLNVAHLFQLWTPAQLGVNSLTEPAAGTSAQSSIIDTRGVKDLTITGVCTAGNYTVNLTNYDTDGATAIASNVQVVTAIAAATAYTVHIGVGTAPLSNTGTISASNATLTLPQRAISFSFTNAGGAGTCTARLYLQY